MRLYGMERAIKFLDRLGQGLKEGEVLEHPIITKNVEKAQKKVEENNFGIRKRLLEYDDVMNAQREVIYKRPPPPPSTENAFRWILPILSMIPLRLS